MVPQAKLPFAIPFVSEDIPLYVDPFPMAFSIHKQVSTAQDSLHLSINHIGNFERAREKEEAKGCSFELSNAMRWALATPGPAVESGWSLGQAKSDP